MKMLLFLALFSSANAFAEANITCSEFQGQNVRHYFIEIDTANKVAVVDTIGTRSELKLNNVGFLESLPPQKLYRFSGPFVGEGVGTWKVGFNETQMYAGLAFIRADGSELQLGQSNCIRVR